MEYKFKENKVINIKLTNNIDSEETIEIDGEFYLQRESLECGKVYISDETYIEGGVILQGNEDLMEVLTPLPLELVRCDSLYMNCINLEHICLDHFINCKLEDVRYMFKNCTSFDPNNKSKVIQELPELLSDEEMYERDEIEQNKVKHLFQNQPIKSAIGTFENTAIRACVTEIFGNMSMLKTMTSTFKDCDKLVSIHLGFFKGQPNISTMDSAFENTSIKMITDGLFAPLTLLFSANASLRNLSNNIFITPNLHLDLPLIDVDDMF